VQVSDSSTAERAAQKLGTHFGFPVSFNANFKLPHYRKASQRLTFRHADFPLMWILVTKCNGFIVPYCGEVKASARMGITTKSDIGWQRRFLCGSELIWCNLIQGALGNGIWPPHVDLLPLPGSSVICMPHAGIF
jgi:hypothetical protein